ncbi:MAG TPA: DUF4199 domain-containing protein [Ohtaekwangia sp.]|nr:DUF4199 domain-containing protein [Ohtaekwangia sp.]
MKKIVIIYGLIAGIIVSVIMFISLPLQEAGYITYDYGMLVGYTSMVVALSMVFFGIKTYRDQQLDGKITFLQALKTGLVITAIASVMYAISWEVFYNTIASDFMERYTQHYLDKMAANGATAVEIDAQRASFESLGEMYKNPFIRFGMTLAEILPVGVVITLISAALLRKREVLPA